MRYCCRRYTTPTCVYALKTSLYAPFIMPDIIDINPAAIMPAVYAPPSFYVVIFEI